MLPSRGHQSSKSVIFNMCSQYHLGTCEKCKSDRFPPPSAQTCWIRTSGYMAQQPVFWQGQPSTSYVIQMHFRVWEPLSFPSPVELRLGWVSLTAPGPRATQPRPLVVAHSVLITLSWSLKSLSERDYPGGSGTKTPRSQYRGPGVWSLVRELDPACRSRELVQPNNFFFLFKKLEWEAWQHKSHVLAWSVRGFTDQTCGQVHGDVYTMWCPLGAKDCPLGSKGLGGCTHKSEGAH